MGRRPKYRVVWKLGNETGRSGLMSIREARRCVANLNEIYKYTEYLSHSIMKEETE